MQLKNGTLKTLTNSLDQEYGTIYESIKTRIYDCNRNKIIIVTKEYPKFLYYKFGIKNNFEHIPKIYDLMEDHINKVYIIKREELYPITDMNKLTRIDIIKSALEDRIKLNDKLVLESLAFINRYERYVALDFSPHCFMETKNKKIVVSDLFMEI